MRKKSCQGFVGGSFGAEEALGKRGMVDGAAGLVARLEQEYQRVCQALAAEGVKTRGS